MNNRGYVTVFLTLILLAMLGVAATVIKICEFENARTKTSTALSSAMSGELANYDRFIFDRYHILLMDKNAGDAGEGQLEQSIQDSLQTDLGDEYTVNSVELSGVTGILDDDCKEFKRQINQNFNYQVAEKLVDKIIEKTKGEDEPIDQDTLDDIDSDIDEKQKLIKDDDSDSDDSEKNNDSNNSKNKVDLKKTDDESDSGKNKDDKSDDSKKTDKKETTKDPRKTLKTYTDAGIASLILPENVTLSGNVVDYSNLPSGKKTGNKLQNIGTEFNNLDRMKLDSRKTVGWGTEIVTDVESISYAGEYFNCLTEKKYDDTYLNLEMEYIIAGEDTDGGNYKQVVDEILLIRFGFNMAYIITDSVKMGECATIAAGICWYFPFAEPVVQYLLAGCWAYIESVADLYLLVRGHSIPYLKTFDTWMTDFESLGRLSELSAEETDSESGLNYKEYLMILIALKGKTRYYRMLDIMQMNANMKYNGNYTLKMNNCITAFAINAEVEHKGLSIEEHEEAGY